MKDQTYFLLKRLHSLLGVVPIAGFVVFHLFENSSSVMGQEAFNHTVQKIRGIPYIYLLEIGLLTPIAFHALLGAWLARTARHNALRFANAQNIGYTLQRLTGGVLLVFIAWHVWTTRFAGVPSGEFFQYMQAKLSHPLASAAYAVGVLSAAFHLGNGLWGFAVAWGLITGARSMDLAWKACLGISLGVALMGLNALAGFHGKGVKAFFHSEPPAAAADARGGR